MRPLNVRQAVLLLALATLAIAPGCGGSGDPTSAPQPSSDTAYVRATFTLLDSGAPCRPGVACDPELVSCDGLTAFTVPKTWTMHATQATAGAYTYTPHAGTAPASGTLVITGTDTARNSSVSLAFLIFVDATTSALSPAPAIVEDDRSTFANIETSCTRLNGGNDPFTLFGIVLTEPKSVVITQAPTAGGEFIFATRSGVGLSGGLLEGTFDFTAENREEFGVSVYQGRVRVQGCFSVPVAAAQQGVAVTAEPASPACN